MAKEKIVKVGLDSLASVEDVSDESSLLVVSAKPLEIAENLETKSYWCGVKNGSPYQNLHLAGISFHSFTQTTRKGGAARTHRDNHPGQRLSLTQGQVEKLKVAAVAKIVRTSPAMKFNAGDSRFTVQAGDKYIGEWIYCVEVEGAAEALGSNWMLHEPPALVR